MSQSPAGPPEPSEIAQRYQVIKKLGAGAFGTVYKAKDKILGRMVAIKTIRLEGLAASGGAGLEELMDRFKREAMVSAQLKHPNIVTIYDIGESGGMSYIAMEFIDGVGLDRVIAGAGHLPVDRAAALAAQVADALDFAHRHNVVHRDIKPANIMVEAGDRVKVTDFGIAKVTDSADHLTATGSLLGTPSYMSPEQARGSAIDGRSDLFAVGAILYEMVAGKKAFRGDSITGLIFKIITEEPPPLQETDPAIPEELVRIVARALAKDPGARYQAGRELAEDLQVLIRPGSTPTLRQSEMGTSPGYVPGPTTYIPASAPTMAGSPQPAAAPATQIAAAPAAATRISPAVATRVSASPTVVRPVPAPPPASSGSPVGLIVGLLAGGFILLAVVGIAAFLFVRSRQGATPGPVPPTTIAAAPSMAPTEMPPSTLAAASPTEPPAASLATPPPGTTPASGREASTAADGSGRRSGGRNAGTGGATEVPPASTLPPPVNADGPEAVLDREPAENDGRAAGNHAADTYRQNQGYGSNSTFGTNRHLNARQRYPHTNQPVERQAIFVLLNVINFEESFQKQNGRYGTFKEVLPAGAAMAHPNVFQRHGYRFELHAERENFQVTATPLSQGLQPYVADDSGYVRVPED